MFWGGFFVWLVVFFLGGGGGWRWEFGNFYVFFFSFSLFLPWLGFIIACFEKIKRKVTYFVFYLNRMLEWYYNSEMFFETSFIAVTNLIIIIQFRHLLRNYNLI